MPPRPQFHPELDEVPERVDSYSYPAIVKEYDAAWSRIKEPPPLAMKVSYGMKTRGAFYVNRVLETVRKMYKPGDLVSPAELAKVIGTSRQNVSNAVNALRRAGMWPYRGIREPKDQKLQTSP